MKRGIGKRTPFRFKEKSENRAAFCKRAKILAEKYISLNQNAHNHHVLFPLAFERVARKRLPDVAVALVHQNAAVLSVAQRLVTVFVGKVEKEKILPVKPLVNLLPLERADHNILIRLAKPLRNDLVSPFVIHKIPLKVWKISGKLFNRVNGARVFCVHTAIIAQILII